MKSNRVYVINYNIQLEKVQENRTLYYSFDERQQFIQEYARLSQQWYISELKAYYAELQEVNVQQMIEAIWMKEGFYAKNKSS